MKSSIIIAGAVAIATVAFVSQYISSDNDILTKDKQSPLFNTTQNSSQPQDFQAEVLAPAGLTKLVYESHNISTGVIGINAETNIDDPHDNTFHVYLDGEVESGRQAWLEYDLYGAEDYTSVSRVINDQVAIGGAFVKLSNEWSVQSERIDASQLHKGDNIVRFSIPGNQDFNYTVKNVRIRFDESVDMSRRIVLNQPMSKSYYNRYGYISGFVSGNGSENAKIYANGKPVRSNQAIFEGIVDQIASNDSDWKAVITAVFADGQIISDTARFCNPATCDFSNEIAPDIAYNETSVTAQMPVHMNIPGFELNGEPGSVSGNVKMSVTGLRSQDMPLPRLAMVNVTGGSDGFRCLPHGNLFVKEVEVRIKYDTARIPQGYGPKDIRTFYYDESQSDWVMLPYDTVDIASCEIVSHTNHFTDFINAILKTPESPQTQAFTPTSMKDMKFADPIAHINMMSPPQANNSGTANMSYPIQVPAGRQGLQPQLAISYSSEGGNGYLGVGWGMNTPSISVETRWGVPLYSSSQETEEYLVNGQQVVELDITTNDTTRLPLIHQASYRSRNTDSVMFSYRVEGAFDRIIRRGSSPSTYWWEVIDKQGTHYYYGKYSSDASVNSNCVLTDASGNIAHWALAEVRDQYGNYVKYNYQIITFTGTPGYGGKQIYPTSIVYTGFGSTDGKYSVNFQYIGRNDYSIAGNYGFLQVTDKLLQRILVKYETDTVRMYYVKYDLGAYEKSVVCAISDVTDYASLGQVVEMSCPSLKDNNLHGVKTHSFEYYKEEGVSFSSNTSILLTQLEEQENISGVNYEDSVKQSIGKSKSTSGSIGGSFSFGIGAMPNKGNTIGINVSAAGSVMKDKVMFMDINGDGITDKVLKDNGDYKYFKGELNSNNEVYFPLTPETISGLPMLSRNYSYSGSLGGEIEVKLSPALQGTGSISGSVTKQITDAYFADVNADGYVDFIKRGDVYFNRPDANGDPIFSPEDCSSPIQYFAEDSCYYIIHDGEIDSAFAETDDSTKLFYRRDPVRIWIAPDDGKLLAISNNVKRLDSVSYSQSPLKYSIQKNDTILYCDSIDAGDTTLHNTLLCPVNYTAGDRFYFRLHSDEDMGFDDVYWEPIVLTNQSNCQTYNSTNDADGKKIFIYSYSNDNILTDKKYFIAPLSGTVRLTSLISSPAQSDSITYRIKFNQSLLVDNTYSNGLISSYSYTDTLNIVEGDSILFDLLSNTNVNWNDIDFDARIQYLTADSLNIDTTNQFYSIDYYPTLHMSLFPERKIKPVRISLASGTYAVYPNLQFATGSNVNGTVTFTAKKNRSLLSEKTLTIQNSQITGNTVSNRLNFTLSSTTVVLFEYFTSDNSVGNAIELAYAYDSTRSTSYSSGYYSVFPDSMQKFGNLYRGWGQFSYFDSINSSSCLDVIDESKLFMDFASADSATLAQFPFDSIDTSMSYEDVDSIFSTYSIPNANTMVFAPMSADYKNQKWVDFCPSAYFMGSQTGSTAGLSALYSVLMDTAIFDEGDFPFPDIDNPVSSTTTCGTARAINKKCYQLDESFSIGLGINSIHSATASANFSQTYGKSDFMDMNGDRFPDIINQSQIQYTNAQGGLSDTILLLDKGRVTQGSGFGSGLSYGIKPIQSKAVVSSNTGKGPRPKTVGSFGMGEYLSTSNVSYMMTDINGDGLPDIINQDDDKVQLNYGYDFVSEETWDADYLSKTNSFSTSMNIGSKFNRDNYSWAAGIGGNLCNSYSRYSLMDFNNDGLADICYVQNNMLYAFINTGHSFYSDTICSAYDKQLSKNLSHTVGGNLAFTAGVSFLGLKFEVTPYIDANISFSSEKYRLSDLNGDGWMDYVKIDNDTIKVNYGVPKKVNILKKVTTPVQSSYSIDYTMTYPDRYNPQSKWVYASLKVYDGFNGDGQDTSYYKYSYADPKYHRMERELFGFETVTTKQFRNFTVQNCYRYSVEKYLNDDNMFKGLKYYEVNYDSLNRKYVETYYTWDPKEISTGTIVPEDSTQCFGPYYPAISQEDKYFYEGQTVYQIHTKKSYRHGPFGNVKQYVNYGDTAYTTDDFRAEIAYSYNSTRYLMSMVDSMNVYDNGNALLQRRTGAYTLEGRIAQIGAYDGSAYAYTDISYNSYGNIDTIRYPENVNNERLQYVYSYETTLYTYPESVTDYWGNTSYTDYDFKLGLPIFVHDISGNPMEFTYFADGKVSMIAGPNELNNSIPYTIKCEYWDESGGSYNNRWARTRHYDPINTGNEFITMNFSDGLGRSIQSKQKATILGVDSMVVSGNVYYDAFGRSYRASLPATQALGSDSIYFSFTPTVFATTTFDYLDRPLLQTAFDNTTVGYCYDFGQDAFGKTCFKTRVTDPNSKVTDKYTSGRGLNTSVTAPLSTITKFVYDPLGTLVQSVDPEGYTTNYKYDLLGRLEERIHPDAGTTSYKYDLAGNVLTTQTENLASTSQYIHYNYSDNRLISIEYPQNPEMNVLYEYGAANSGNQSGRLVKQQDASGVQTFEYGNMGELIKNIHTFVVPGGNNYTFETDWEYDSWNRMKSILYPDGELLSYHYDNGGKLSSLNGVKSSNTYYYIDSVQYNLFGSRTWIDYANGTYAEYTYNPLNQRLTNLVSYEQSGLVMQNIDYTYDAASNITGIQNNSDYVGYNTDLGGGYKYLYQYDDLYRLLLAEGSTNTSNNGTLAFETSMTYSASGNIASKSMYAQTLIGGNVDLKNYSSNYQYYTGQPHTVQYAGGNSYSWDLNGNLIQRGGESERNLCWDEENRLMSVHDNGEKQHTLSAYIYDAGGERVWKLAGDVSSMYINGQGYVNATDLGKTLYANPYVVVSEKEYSKHYYIEGERVCTKIGGGFGPAPYFPVGNPLEFIKGYYEQISEGLYDMVTRSIECVEYGGDFSIYEKLDPAHNDGDYYEELQYFYHSDHLGSSSFITDAIGYAEQHLQYLPFGETFIDQQSGSFDSRYKFSAKELDDETDYSYFGARYYDSDLSVWLSVDPFTDDYPSESGYMYCGGNPIYYKDIKGNFKFPTDKNEEGITYEQDFANKYPTMYKYLKNTNAEKGSIMDMTKSERYINAMIKNSEGKLTKEQIVKDFKYGAGPALRTGENNQYNSEYDYITLSKNMLSSIENASGAFETQAAMTWGVKEISHEYLERYTDDNVKDDNGNYTGNGVDPAMFSIWNVEIFDITTAKRAVNIRNGNLNKRAGEHFEVDMSVLPAFYDMSVDPPEFIDNSEPTN